MSQSDESDLCLSTIRSVSDLHLVPSSGHVKSSVEQGYKGQTDRNAEGQMDGWMGRQTNVWMADGQTQNYSQCAIGAHLKAIKIHIFSVLY